MRGIASWGNWLASSRWVVLIATLMAVWMSHAATPAASHGILERSNPPVDAALSSAPRQVELRFTEPVHPGLSSVVVLDPAGRPVSGRPSISADRKTLVIPLRGTGEGVLTVRWHVLSTVDGHTTSGSFAFAIGVAPRSESVQHQEVSIDPRLAAVRWISLTAAMLLSGSILFDLLVLRPALGRVAQRDLIEPQVASRVRWLMVSAGLFLLGRTAVQIWLQMAVLMGEAPLGAVTDQGLWAFVSGTKLGWSALIQSGMVLVLLILAKRQGRIMPAAAAGGVLFGFSVASHAVGSGLVAVAADWIHLIAAALWVGGLASLLLVLLSVVPTQRRTLALPLTPRFSMVAGWALGILVITGLYSALTHVPTVRALAITAYGRLLLTKMMLVVPLAALGAVNRFLIRPRLEAAGNLSEFPRIQRRFLRVVGGEAFLACVILLIVAVLTITPPARVVLSVPAAQPPLRFAGLARDLYILLRIVPGAPGWNRFELMIMKLDREPFTEEARVFLRLTKLDEDLKPTMIRSQVTGQGRYVAEGGALGIRGWWEVEVIVRRRGRLDVTTSFPLRLQPSQSSSDPTAEQLLERVRIASARLHTWRELQQITDGRGGVTFTLFEFSTPDRMRYRSDGTEGIVIGAVQYLRTGHGAWERGVLAQPLRVEGMLQYTRGARGVVPGRWIPCEWEMCQVLFWEWDQQTAFAAAIGQRSHRVHKLLMVGSAHYMTVQYSDFNVPGRITTPK